MLKKYFPELDFSQFWDDDELALKEYVDETVPAQVALLVPEEVQKYVSTATEEEIEGLFSV